MFGNRLGWGISAVLVGLMLLLIWKLGQMNAISAPSQGMVVQSAKLSLNLLSRPELLEPIKLPGDPLAVLPSMTDPTDAAPIYRKAIEAYDTDKWAYEPNSRTGMLKTENVKDFPAVAALMEATRCSKMNLFAAGPAAVINYDTSPADIEKLQKIGNACTLLGLMKQAGANKQDGIPFYEAAFSLGHKLVTERIRWPEFEAGWQLMIGSAVAIERADPSRSSAKAFADACSKYHSEQIKVMWAVIGAIDPGIIGRTAGDVFYIAKHAKERMWRVEAVLKLGRYRFDAGENGRGADQRWAGLWVKRMADDDKEDPVVREAARKARDLTLEEYRKIH